MTTPRLPARRLMLALLPVACALAPVSPRAGSAQPPTAAADDDPDERAFRRADAQRAVRENCLICHSEELVSGQRLTPKQWKAEVEKMVGWGAPLAREQQQPVIDFLAAEYPASVPAPRPGRMTYREAVGQDAAEAPGALKATRDPAQAGSLYDKNCANCHGPDGQGSDLGPNLVEKPFLLHPAGFSQVVRQGRGRMPGFAATLDPSAEADLLLWLRARRYRPGGPSPTSVPRLPNPGGS